MNINVAKKIHFVSVGLEVKRVGSYLTRSGMDKVFMVHFKETREEEVEPRKAILSVLEERRDELEKRLKENGILVEEMKLEIMKESVSKICLELMKRIQLEREKEENIEVILGIGAGHTTFKIACYMLACLDPNVQLRYFETREYLDAVLTPLINNYNELSEKISKENLKPREERKVLKEFFESFREISDFGSGGWSSSVTNIIDIPPIPVPPISAEEFGILDFIVNSRNGRVEKIKKLALFLLKNKPEWYEMPVSATKKKEEKNQVRAISNNLRRTHLEKLQIKGCVEIFKEGQRTAVQATEFGKLRHAFLTKNKAK